MELSLKIAGILGPLLMILSLSEYLNFKIWETVHPTLVYLNGLVLLAAGLIIINLHNTWVADWPVIITITGWLLTIAGSMRMFFPTQKQASKSTGTDLLILALFLTGGVLSFFAFF